MQILRKRKKKLRLRIFVKTNLKNSKNLCIIAEDLPSLKIQITVILSAFLKDA